MNQQDIDQVLGPGQMTVEQWEAAANNKLCCTTGRCATCAGTKCGFAGQEGIFTGAAESGPR